MSSADPKLIRSGSVERARGQAEKAVGSADLHPVSKVMDCGQNSVAKNPVADTSCNLVSAFLMF